MCVCVCNDVVEAMCGKISTCVYVYLMCVNSYVHDDGVLNNICAHSVGLVLLRVEAMWIQMCVYV